MDISKELKISLSLVALFLGVLLFLMTSNNSKNRNLYSSPLSNETVSNETLKSFSLSEVAKHDSQNDCWIIIDRKVYNATSYLGIHPGGAKEIVPYCGADATVPFEGMRKHGARATEDLSTIIVGTIK
jgi:cytochrome b involved in lipid metabolism